MAETVPDRYTIRAGRNLPDKEFRYLRTVIVTAAVYWGFSQELRLLTPSLTFQHRAGVRPYTSSFDFAESVFLLNSRLGLFTAAPHGRLFSSYETICLVPTTDHSSA